VDGVTNGAKRGGATSSRAGHAFAHGGVAPGYAPGVDSIMAWVSPGEGFLVPEAVRGLGGESAIHAINKRFSNRIPGGGNHFAGGGVVGAALGAGGDIYHGVTGRSAGQDAGSLLGVAEIPIKKLIGALKPELAHDLGKGAFDQIDKAVRFWLARNVDNATMSATVSGPNSGSALDYAKIIVQQAKNLSLGPKGAEIGLMTALVESNLKNYANANIPESLALPHDAVGSDHYSAGLFQQQTGPFGNYWGSVAQVMNPAYASERFYKELLQKVPNFQTVDPGVAAQTVQVSAVPDAYAGRKGDADALLGMIHYDNGGMLQPGVTHVYNGTGRPEPVFTDAQWAKLEPSKGSGATPAQTKLADTINFHEAIDPQTAAMEIERRMHLASSI
jgi:hypothetical protein